MNGALPSEPDALARPLTLTSPAGRRVIVALAVGQALLLLAFHEAVVREWVLVENFLFTVPYLTLVIAVPAALYLLLDDPRRRRPWLLAGGLALILLPLALYTGSQVLPMRHVSTEPVLRPYVITLAVGWFVSLAFMQTARRERQFPAFAGTSFDYHVLFEAGWYHLLTLALTALFTGLFWGVLTLWDALFDVLDVTFFGEVFFDRRFTYAATGLVGGLGLVLTRSYPGATTALLHLLLTLLKALLPLLSLVSLVFLAALPFTGVAPLWATGRPTLLMLVLLALMILFLNAAFQDGPDTPPYPKAVRRLVEAAFVVLPAYAALSAYALSLRIAQYGWTADRLWAVLLVGILGGFALAYAYAALRSLIGRAGETWLAFLQPANIALSLGTVVLLVLVNTPVLDPHRLAVADQIGRLKAGTANAEVLTYLRFEAGARGYRALQQLQATDALADQPYLATRLDTALHATKPYILRRRLAPPPEQLRAAIEVLPDTLTVPTPLIKAVSGHKIDHHCLDPEGTCLLIAADIQGDARREYVLFSRLRPRWLNATVYAQRTASSENEWGRVGRLAPVRDEEEIEALLDALRAGNYRTVPPDRRDLKVGKQRLRLR